MSDTRVPLKVYLVARPAFDVGEFLTFLSDHDTNWRRTPSAKTSEEIVEAAGRVCYMSFGHEQSPRSTSEYVANLVQMGHESVLEHVTWSFVLAGISRSLSHQLVRHRVGFAFSQLSQQYHDESNANFVVPPILESDPDALAAWHRAVGEARTAYAEILRMLDQGKSLPREGEGKREFHRAILSAARSVLPNSTATVIFMSANARALRHFLAVRGSIVGDEEMRFLTASLLTCLQGEAPSLFSDFRVDTLPDGSPIVRRVE